MQRDTPTSMKCGKTSVDSIYKVHHSKAFKKSWKRLLQSGKKDLVLKVQSVVSDLTNEIPLDKKHEDHQLKGDMQHLRECHVSPDLLLIYSVDIYAKEITLVKIGNHSELFG